MTPETSNLTIWLQRLRDGHPEAHSVVLEQIYGELHRLAEQYMRKERGDHTLQPTALLHEAYIRLVQQPDRTWVNRNHFLAAASQVMRHILVDYARARTAQKRGGAKIRVELDEELNIEQNQPEEIIALDEALTRLSAWDERQSKIVELRFFGGLTEEETAGVLDISVRTVRREWRMAKAWLFGEIYQNPRGGEDRV